MKNYDTVTEAVNDLVKRGYTADFNIDESGESIICHEPLISLSPDEFEIDEVYRFEGATDPGDEMIVFAISSKKYKAKGIIVNAYGVYADGAASKVVQHLHKHLNPS